MRKLILIFLIVIVVSCSINDDPYIEFIPIVYWDLSMDCLVKENTEYIVETEQQLIEIAQDILGDSAWQNCIDTTNFSIDFSEFMLLGKYTKYDINDTLYRTVLKPTEINRITYKLELTKVPGSQNNSGFDTVYSTMNWIKIEKPPANFEVNILYFEY